jgi:hypothetical protein
VCKGIISVVVDLSNHASVYLHVLCLALLACIAVTLFFFKSFLQVKTLFE